MEENNRKGPGVFYAVVGVATLVVAIIGATFAYFSASANATGEPIEGETNNNLAEALSVSVERVKYEVDGTVNGNLVPAEFDATTNTGVTAAVSKKCVDGSYTGCHVYKITAKTTQNLNNANIMVNLTAPAADKGNWKYLVYTGSESAADAITTAESTFASTNNTVNGITGTDIHNAALTTTGVTYYLMVYLDNLNNTAQNAGETDETGSYSGTVTMYAAGGKVSATFSAS